MVTVLLSGEPPTAVRGLESHGLQSGLCLRCRRMSSSPGRLETSGCRSSAGRVPAPEVALHEGWHRVVPALPTGGLQLMKCRDESQGTHSHSVVSGRSVTIHESPRQGGQFRVAIMRDLGSVPLWTGCGGAYTEKFFDEPPRFGAYYRHGITPVQLRISLDAQRHETATRISRTRQRT